MIKRTLPLLLIANDRKYMRDKANGRIANGLGGGFYLILVVVAVAALSVN